MSIVVSDEESDEETAFKRGLKPSKKDFDNLDDMTDYEMRQVDQFLKDASK